jgi:hypothetical protein
MSCVCVNDRYEIIMNQSTDLFDWDMNRPVALLSQLVKMFGYPSCRKKRIDCGEICRYFTPMI